MRKVRIFNHRTDNRLYIPDPKNELRIPFYGSTSVFGVIVAQSLLLKTYSITGILVVFNSLELPKILIIPRKILSVFRAF